MARSIKDIYDSMITEKNTFSELQNLQPNIDNHQKLLNDLNSPSKVAVWRLLLWVTAVGIWIFEKLLDAHKTEVENYISQSIPGSLPWYRDLALNFQFGDTLIYSDRRFKYLTIDPDKKIVTQAATVESQGRITIKLAKGTSPNLEKLNNAELIALKAYFNKMKYAGTEIVYISDDPDELHIETEVYYDPLVLNSDGSLISDDSIFPIEDTIKSFIASLPFNSSLNIVSLTDAIQSTIGVDYAVITLANAKYGGYAFEDFNNKASKFQYQANAGYMIISDSYPLSENITYVANV